MPREPAADGGQLADALMETGIIGATAAEADRRAIKIARYTKAAEQKKLARAAIEVEGP